MYAYLYEMGSVVMEVEDNRLDLKFINNSGNITDYFTIDKNINTAAIDTTITSGSTITLTANWGGSDFEWNHGGATTKSINVSPTVNTQYIVTNANGCLSDTFNVTVVIGNNPPEATADVASTINEPIEIDVLDNDTDPEVDELTLFEITVAPNHGGTAIINDNDTPADPTDDFVDYTPSGVYFGVETFSYSVCDDYLTPQCDVAVVSVTVTQNTSPVAGNDNSSIFLNESVEVDVLANDSDANSHHVLTISDITSAPNQGGSAVINDNSTPLDPSDDYIDFTPSGIYVGVETFSYEVCDNGNPIMCDEATVNITINTCVDGSSISGPEFTYGSEWKYNDLGVDLGATWKNTGYNDDCWDYAEGNFGFGDPVITTLSGQDQTTIYFRKHVNISNVALINELDMSIIRDDGAVVYVNGTEVYRSNMPGGAINYGTLASTNISGADEAIEHSFQVSNHLLVNGDNVIAVEIHQENASSTDINFDMKSSIIYVDDYTWAFQTISGNIFLDNDFSRGLSSADHGSGGILLEVFQDLNENEIIDAADALVSSAISNLDGTYVLDVYPPEISSIALTIANGSDDAVESAVNGNMSLTDIQLNSLDIGGAEIEILDSLSVWKYFDNGLPPGNWRGNNYNDAGWSTGSAHFGFSNARVPVTTLSGGKTAYYFRKTINIADVDAPNYGVALAQVRADDGFVIYINGQEVARRNLPNGTIAHSTLATNKIASMAELAYVPIHISNPGFINGNNTIAVEIHQFNEADSDAFFDMHLVAKQVGLDEVGLRFTNIAIPQGAIIVDANLKWQAASESTGLISVNVQGQAIDNAPTFTGGNSNISIRTRTSNSSEWNSEMPVVLDESVQIGNLKSIVQEIVNRPGWVSGNALALFMSGFTNSFNSSETEKAPVLTIAFVDSSNMVMKYILNVDEKSLPTEYVYMTEKNPVVTIAEALRSESNINIGYLGASSVCVAGADADFDELHIFNRFNGANKLVGSFNGATEIGAIALSLNSDSLFAVNADELGLIDITTGEFTAYGPVIGSGDGSAGSITFNDVEGLAFDQNNNWLWAIHRRVGSADVLFAIDPTTGLFVSDVFGAGVDYIIPSGAGILGDIDDIAVHPNSGNLLALNSNEGDATNLVEIDLASGVITIINATGENNMLGQGFHSDGIMYATSERIDVPGNMLFSVDTATAALELIGYFNNGGSFKGCDCNSGPFVSVIEGVVFADMDANGIFNSGDSPDEAVMVYLVEDLNEDDIISIGDALLDSVLTDAFGQFFFAINREGQFLVAPNMDDLPGGIVLTTPDVQDARFSAKGSLDFENDFGYRNNLLPVELSSFYGEEINRENHLYWVTLSELNNSHFEVLRSQDAIHFEKIGSVLGNGNATDVNHYHFIDHAPFVGGNYYQLKQVDFDGTPDFSNIILLNIEENAKLVTLNLWPNPAKERIQIDGLSTLYGQNVQVSITDLFGKIVANSNIQISNNRIEINIDQLTAGYYIIDFTYNSQRQSIPFVKQ
jgi:hypothetical protein